MSAGILDAPVPNSQRWGGYVLSGLPALFLIFDAVSKIGRVAPAVEMSKSLGVPERLVLPLGIVLLVSTLLYLIPRTTVLGAILLTGYLGGAVATHVRAGQGWFPILFPVAMGVLIWGGLYLRDRSLHSLLPLTTPASSTASKLMLWGGRVLSALPVLLLLFSATMKLSQQAAVLDGIKQFGYDPGVVLGLGIVELLCTVLYVIPRTSVLGAILLVGYLGGATFTHLRMGDAFIAPVLVGAAVWGGLFLRDARVRAQLPLRS